MNIPRSKLIKIIKEEVGGYFEDIQDVQMGRGGMKEFAAMLSAHAITWLNSEDYEIKEHTVDVWLDLMNTIVVHWKDTANNKFGCEINTDLPECRKFAAIEIKMQKDIEKLVDDAQKRGGSDKRWVKRNFKKLKKSLQYVPASDKPADIMNTRIWIYTEVDGGDDDL
jgi:hypothetical protein